MSDLARLCKPFRNDLIKKNPSGYGDYVAHPVVNQKLLMVCGPFDWEKVDIIRGDVDDLKNVVVAVVWRLTVTIDGIRTVIEETGECENPKNWKHDGSRLKDAVSDAFKRCAMRSGVGLHLWAQKDFIITDELIDAAIAGRHA